MHRVHALELDIVIVALYRPMYGFLSDLLCCIDYWLGYNANGV